MSRSEPMPTQEQARALTEAAERGFGRACDCRVHDDHVHACAAHVWLCEDPTRRLGVKIWQRLLFMRAQRTALLKGEGFHTSRTAARAAALPPTRLPW